METQTPSLQTDTTPECFQCYELPNVCGCPVQPPTRRYRKTACDRCYRLKKRCNGAYPCLPCIKSRIECQLIRYDDLKGKDAKKCGDMNPVRKRSRSSIESESTNCTARRTPRHFPVLSSSSHEVITAVPPTYSSPTNSDATLDLSIIAQTPEEAGLSDRLTQFGFVRDPSACDPSILYLRSPPNTIFSPEETSPASPVTNHDPLVALSRDKTRLLSTDSHLVILESDMDCDEWELQSDDLNDMISFCNSLVCGRSLHYALQNR